MKLIHISAAMSLDGRIDDRSKRRLILSSSEDLTDMYTQRANCDAILIGANTIRKDNPSLLLPAELIQARVNRGQPAELIKVTITKSGDLDPQANFFSKGIGEKLVLCPPGGGNKLSGVAKIIPIKEPSAINIIHTLEDCGINSLFIEGGTSILTMFLSQGVFHKLRLAIAPFFVGDQAAPAFVANVDFKNNANNRLKIVSMRNLGNTAVIDIVNEGFKNG